MMGFIWFWLVAIMIVGYVVLDGFDLGVGILHLFLVRNEFDARPLSQHRSRLGRQRSLAAGGRRHALLRLSAALCFSLQRLLSAPDDRALAARPARHQFRIAQPHRRRRLARAARRRLRTLERICSPSSSELPWPTSSAVFPCRPMATSFFPSGPTGSPAHSPAFSIGIQSSAACALVALTLHGALWLIIKTSGAWPSAPSISSPRCR